MLWSRDVSNEDVWLIWSSCLIDLPENPGSGKSLEVEQDHLLSAQHEPPVPKRQGLSQSPGSLLPKPVISLVTGMPVINRGFWEKCLHWDRKRVTYLLLGIAVSSGITGSGTVLSWPGEELSLRQKPYTPCLTPGGLTDPWGLSFSLI